MGEAKSPGFTPLSQDCSNYHDPHAISHENNTHGIDIPLRYESFCTSGTVPTKFET